jgi:hypothetical protein
MRQSSHLSSYQQREEPKLGKATPVPLRNTTSSKHVVKLPPERYLLEPVPLPGSIHCKADVRACHGQTEQYKLDEEPGPAATAARLRLCVTR